MMAVAEKNMEQDGFFEGVYDYLPNLKHYVDDGSVREHLPAFTSRGDLLHARPVLFGFPRITDKHLPRLALPYAEKNNIVQIGNQYWNDSWTDDRSPVPDGYVVTYSRAGRGRFGTKEGMRGSDQERSLYVNVLRSSVAMRLADAEIKNNDDAKRWQRIARVGRPVGNAILAMSVVTHSYRAFLSGSSNTKHGELVPVEDDELAEQVFSTVLYWEE